MDIDARLGHHIKRAEQELIARKSAALKPTGLNVAQYTVLLVLSQSPGLSGAELARRCLVTPQTMSSVINTLIGKEFVTKTGHPIHTRIQEVRLTRRGRSTLRSADEKAVAVETGLAGQFTDAEREMFVTFLDRAAGFLEDAAVNAS